MKIFLDTADIATIRKMRSEVDGFTTNPSLMLSASVKDYACWAQEVTEIAAPLPVSFEVVSSDLLEIARQARKIAAWGPHVWPKVPIITEDGASTLEVIKQLTDEGIPVNVTAMLSLEQVRSVLEVLEPEAVAILSLFAGRIADCGKDPTGTLECAVWMSEARSHVQVLWASVRSVKDLVEAEEKARCHIVTVPPAILAKRHMLRESLEEVSRQTVQQFMNDARKANYAL